MKYSGFVTILKVLDGIYVFDLPFRSYMVWGNTDKLVRFQYSQKESV
jgi:hypothetical protein